MGIFELVLLAAGLAMDAFAVSVCKGLSVKKIKPSHALTCAAWFGFFQFLMPLIGYFLGYGFQELIQEIDHWVAFFLLAAIGINMIRESLSNDEDVLDPDFSFRAMLPLAVATSIDALAVGITFAFLQVNIIAACLIIGVITFIISVAGVAIGNAFGARFKAKAEFAGGAILVLLGVKILLEHLGILSI